MNRPIPIRERIVAKDLTGVPPRHESELEAAVLAEALFDHATAEEIRSLGLVPTDLFQREHQVLWAAFLRLMEAGQEPTLHALKRDLEERVVVSEIPGAARNEFELVGQFGGITRLQNHPVAGNLAKAVADLRALAEQRRTGDAASLIAGEARIYRGPPAEFVERARTLLETRLDNATASVASDMVSMADAVADAVSHINAVQRGEVDPRGIALPNMVSLTALFGGLRLGRLRVVGADTGGGKSTLALQEAVAAAGTFHNGERVGVIVVSGEMGTRELALRAQMCEGALTEEELFDPEGRQLDAFERTTHTALNEASEALSAKPIELVAGKRSLEDMRCYVRRAARKWRGTARPMVLVVDYLGIMRLPGAMGRMDRHERIAAFTGGIKELALEHNLHVTLLAQFNRSGKKATTEATIADFDGSGAIENDSDQIVIIDRPNLRLPTDQQVRELDDFARVRLAKSRVSKTGARGLAWDGARYRLLDPTQDQRERWHSAQATLAERASAKDRRQQW